MATTQSQLPRPIVNSQLSRFDLLLAAIPLALTAGIVSSFVVAIPFFLGVAAGAVVAATLVGYSIYILTQQSPVSAERAGSFGERTRLE